jgi:hypothetical protein
LTSTKIWSKLAELATLEPACAILVSLRKRRYALEEMRVTSIEPDGEIIDA